MSWFVVSSKDEKPFVCESLEEANLRIRELNGWPDQKGDFHYMIWEITQENYISPVIPEIYKDLLDKGKEFA